MRNKLIILTILVLIVAVVLTACDNTPAVDPNYVAVTGVTISGTGINNGQLNVSVGNRDIPLSVNIRPSTATDKAAKWTSDDPQVATISDAGLLHIVGAGTCTITVKVGDKTDAVQVNVANVIKMQSITFNQESYEVAITTSGSASIDLGTSVTIAPENVSNRTLLWEISPEDANVNINAQGVLSVASTATPDATYTVTAKATDGSGVSQSVDVKIGYTKATGLVFRLTSNAAAKPASYVYNFSLSDSRFENITFYAETRPVGSRATITYSSENPEICDIDAETGVITIKQEGTTTLSASIETDTGTVSKTAIVCINPAVDYVLDDLNVLAEELPDVADDKGLWDYSLEPGLAPGRDTLFWCAQENDMVGLFCDNLDNSGWRGKIMPNNGNGTYIEDGGYCISFTTWDWPYDNDQANAYMFNRVVLPTDANTVKVQVRTISGQYTSGLGKFRVRLVDVADPTQQVFLSINGQLREGYTQMEDRGAEDIGTYDEESGWITIDSVPDYTTGEDFFHCVIPAEWQEKEVYIYIEIDDLHQPSPQGGTATFKADPVLICSIGFTDNENDTSKFAKAE